MRIFTEDGGSFIDAAGGAAVSCLGHSHPAILAAMHEAIDRLQYLHTGSFTHDAMEELADALLEDAPGDLSHAFFVSSGSEAVESALKLARQYFLEIGQPERYRFVARRQSYHGNTLGALAVGGNAMRQAPYKPLLMDAASHIAPCYAYRDQRDDETLEAYGLRVANELETELLTAWARNRRRVSSQNRSSALRWAPRLQRLDISAVSARFATNMACSLSLTRSCVAGGVAAQCLRYRMRV